MVTVLFIGRLADTAGGSERAVGAPLLWADLDRAFGAELAAALRDERVKVALDGAVLADRTALDAGEGAEVAFLPPVSGG
ncbi:MoaD/ThiS family protein [Aurantiacibacter spongiae]|uniref:MoaD/ThiS family protein n=1 Tax=Aurantiacibacter spongiae TaxID=2488860 RepID=A0A3N5CTV0_9SPHN|nr:MoaD/ThiS family protein [Aurantiacibacter spongiae]RPF70830.1 MoaD/ThiS family protein [Aurantiacibacter spongiae]